MSFFLRPDGDVTTTNIASGTYANIDESTYSDSDYLYSTAGVNATYECSLSNPSATPHSGTCTIRLRMAKVDSAGALASAGETVSVAYYVYQGASLVSGGGPVTLSGGFGSYSGTFSTSAVSDWTDLRIRAVATISGSGDTRGMAISWAEIETPDATYNETISFTATAGESLSSIGVFVDTLAAAATAGTSMAGGVSMNVSLAETATVAGSFIGGYLYTGEVTETNTASFDLSSMVTEPNGWEKPYDAPEAWEASGGGGGEWTVVSPTDVDWDEQ